MFTHILEESKLVKISSNVSRETRFTNKLTVSFWYGSVQKNREIRCAKLVYSVNVHALNVTLNLTKISYSNLSQKVYNQMTIF